MEMMYKHPQREAGESGGTEQWGSPGPPVESGDEGGRSLSSWDPGRQAGWTRWANTLLSWALHSPAVHCGVSSLPPGPGEPTAPWSRPLQCIPGGAQEDHRLLQHNYPREDTQPLRPTAVSRGGGSTQGTVSTLLFDAHHFGAFLYQFHSFLPLSPKWNSLFPRNIFFPFPLMAQIVKNPPAMQETQVWSLGQEDHLEKWMITDSSVLAWRSPWTEEPAGL